MWGEWVRKGVWRRRKGKDLFGLTVWKVVSNINLLNFQAHLENNNQMFLILAVWHEVFLRDESDEWCRHQYVVIFLTNFQNEIYSLLEYDLISLLTSFSLSWTLSWPLCPSSSLLFLGKKGNGHEKREGREMCWFLRNGIIGGGLANWLLTTYSSLLVHKFTEFN